MFDPKRGGPKAESAYRQVRKAVPYTVTNIGDKLALETWKVGRLKADEQAFAKRLQAVEKVAGALKDGKFSQETAASIEGALTQERAAIANMDRVTRAMRKSYKDFHVPPTAQPSPVYQEEQPTKAPALQQLSNALKSIWRSAFPE